MDRDRLVVVDENVNKRVVTEFRGRGYRSSSIAELGLKGIDDPEILESLSRTQAPGWIFLTGDDKLPLVHAPVVARFQPTVATIDPRRPEGVSEDAHRRNIAHRWVHAIIKQEPTTIRRYSLTSSGLWKPRRR